MIADAGVDVSRLRDDLDREGFQVTRREALPAAQDRFAESVDVIIAHLCATWDEQLDLVRRIRTSDNLAAVPVIMVCPEPADLTVVAGLETGADDCVVHPVRSRLLVARMRCLLRHLDRSGPIGVPEPEVLSTCDDRVWVHLGRRTVRVDDRDVDLTVTEFEILHCLIASPGSVRSQDDISRAVSGTDAPRASRAIDVHMSSLRRKLGHLGACIQTVRGIGYRMCDGDCVSTSTAGICTPQNQPAS